MNKWAPRVTLGAAIVGGLLSLFALGDRLASWWSSDLTAVATYNEAGIPPSVIRSLDVDALASTFRPSSVARGSRAMSQSRQEPHDGFNDSLEAFHRRVTRLTDTYLGVRGFWNLTIENRSSTKVSAVVLVVPHAFEASVTRDGGAIYDTTVTGRLSIGDLLPAERVTARVWLSGGSVWEDHGIRLSHDQGRGSITVRRPVGRVGQIADHLTDPVIFGVILVGTLFLIVSVVSTRSELKRQREHISPGGATAGGASENIGA